MLMFLGVVEFWIQALGLIPNPYTLGQQVLISSKTKLHSPPFKHKTSKCTLPKLEPYTLHRESSKGTQLSQVQEPEAGLPMCLSKALLFRY